VRVLIDYRSALRSRSGVGEYTFRLVKALHDTAGDNGSGRSVELTAFSSSWKDRLRLPTELAGVACIDRRVPVSVLNFSWHRLGFPSAEALTGVRMDVVHSFHPLLMPSRRAAQVVTIHDLDFLAHPERTRGEIRRDYPALARTHAHRADRIVVVSEFTAQEVTLLLDVPRERISVCRPGAPEWSPRDSPPSDGYVLFFGTLEPRKNVGVLLDAFERVLARSASGSRPGATPRLVLAGNATVEAAPWLERLARPPLAGRVRHLGYVDPARRRELYEGAQMLVQPSLQEGFGFPVLEAMTVGVPVVVTDRGALPEVLGDAGLVVDAEDPLQMADAIERMTTDEQLAAACSARGVARAKEFRWADTAQHALDAYQQAIEHRRRRGAGTRARTT
jgi:glycosyltransferase involved in cell wall biosynthesis